MGSVVEKNVVQLHDKQFETFIPAEKIQEVVRELAVRINADYKDRKPLFIGVLNGAFVFASDLLKNLDIECEITFIKVSSYEGTESTGDVKEQIGLEEDIKGRDVVILEDIVDTGNTMDVLLKDLAKLQPADLKIASLLFKPKAFTRHYNIDYIGFEIPNDFVVGYGLDYDGLGRNLEDVYKATP